MQNPELFQVLQPKQNQFIYDQVGSIYRPKSSMNSKGSRRIDVTPPSQQSNTTKSTRRTVYLRRNGKKREEFDVDMKDMKINGNEITSNAHQFQSPQQVRQGMQALMTGKKQIQSINTLQLGEESKGFFSINQMSRQASQPDITNQDFFKNKHIVEKIKENFQSPPKVKYPYDFQSVDDEQSQAPVQQCFSEVDPLNLDAISLNDPIWQQILPEHLIDQHFIERLIEDNPDYFNHHLGLCACYKCKCGRCRCDVTHMIKLKINGPQISTYTNDFIQKQAQDLNNMQSLNQTNYDTKFLDQRAIDQVTSNQINFEAKQPFKISRHRTTPSSKSGNLSNLTNYRQTFGNWGVDDYGIIKRVQHVSTSGEIPFLGKTNYQETFCHRDKGQSEIFNLKKIGLCPLPTGPFIGVTTSQNAFTQYKLYNSKSPDVQDNKIYRTPVYEGQYRSTASRDYRGDKEEQCPAQNFKKIWKEKLLQKYNTIRDQRVKKQLSIQ